MKMHNYFRAGVGAGRVVHGASSRTADALQQASNLARARNGTLGPGSVPPRGMSGYLDYRGTATARELPRVDPQDGFPLGRFVNPRTGARGRPVTLPPGVVGQHTLLVGPSQAGKTTSVAIPWATTALRGGYATVVADVKGTLKDEIAQAAQGTLRVRAGRVDYRDPRSLGWAFVRDLDNDRRLAAAAEALVGRQSGGAQDPFFWQRDIRFMSALLAAAHASGRAVTPTELLAAAHSQAALKAYLAAYGTPRAQMLLHDAVCSDPFDYPKVMSGVVNALDPLAIPAVDAVTGRDQLRLDDALSGPGLLAFGAPVGDGRLGKEFAALVLNLLIQRLHARQGGRCHPVMLIIDEAARLVEHVDFEEVLSLAASANVSITLVVQDLAQLPEGRVQKGVLANCQTVIAMPGISGHSAELISQRLGRRPEVEVGFSRPVGGHWGQRSVDTRHALAAVVDTREISDLPFGRHCALVHSRPFAARPFVVDLMRAMP